VSSILNDLSRKVYEKFHPFPVNNFIIIIDDDELLTLLVRILDQAIALAPEFSNQMLRTLLTFYLNVIGTRDTLVLFFSAHLTRTSWRLIPDFPKFDSYWPRKTSSGPSVTTNLCHSRLPATQN
jgi:hypothetical protein